MKTLLIAFPIVVMLVHGVMWDQFSDPEGWKTLVATGILSALPALAILIFLYRRRHVVEPARAVRIQFVATMSFYCTILLWFLPLLMTWPGVQVRFDRIWLAIVPVEIVLIYPLMVFFARLDVGRGRSLLVDERTRT